MTTTHRHPAVTIAALLSAALSTTTANGQSPATRTGEWSAYGHDAFGSRFSPLTEINRDNVAHLTVVWTYRTGDVDAVTKQATKFEATPLMVDSTLYLSTPFGRAIALDPETGRERWSYDGRADRGGDWGDFASRGVSTWLDAKAPVRAPCRRRIYLGTIDARIIALDARTGLPCRGFGDSGTVHLRSGLHNTPAFTEEYELTSPPAVINGMIVTGSAVADNYRTGAASGEVRAFDARTGKLRWSWDPVPRDSTDPAWRSWRGALAHSTGAANAWSVIAADSARDLAFVPTGSASPDYYGGERLGDNRYANSIVALRASTGKVVWHFQAVHHDLWDYDVASPPALVNIVKDGRIIAVVLQATKSGQLFVLDRDSGKPVFPVEERPVPASTVYGEVASRTQPFNTVIASLSPEGLTNDQVWGPTPADRDACLEQIRGMRNDGIFTPPSLQGTVQRPSNVGGAHWGGVAYDPVRHIVVVPVNTVAAMVQLIPVDQLDHAEQMRNESRLGDQYTRMHGTPYMMRRRILTGPNKMPCTAPPFGKLVAINLETGARAWEVPLGDPANLKPELAALSKTPLGLPNLGGPIVTAGGLIFIAATVDHLLRAFDIETGKELWKGPLPGGGRATPMTYKVGPNGQQYVVVSVGGGDDWGKGDYVVAFALDSARRTHQ